MDGSPVSFYTVADTSCTPVKLKNNVDAPPLLLFCLCICHLSHLFVDYVGYPIHQFLSRDLHGNGDDGNPADSAGFPRGWKLMSHPREWKQMSRGIGNIILRDFRGNVCSFYCIMSFCNQPLVTY